MADGPYDPLGPWRDLVAQWEKGINSLANTTMASDQFSGSVNSAMNLTLRMQQKMTEVMATYLTTLNLPSKADITAVGDRLASIEARLDRIATLAERVVLAMPDTDVRTVAMPPRTKQPTAPAEPIPPESP